MKTSDQKVDSIYKVTKLQVFFSVLAILLFVFIQVGQNYHLDKVILSPGTADSVSKTIHIQGAKSYNPNGTIRFLTVLVTTNRPTLFEFLKAKYYDDDTEIIKWEEIRGDISSNDENAMNQAAMTASQNSAKVVALTKLGCDVKKSGEGALITNVEKDSAASKFNIKATNIITAIDGTNVSTDQDAVSILSKHKPGEEIVLYIRTNSISDAKEYKVILGENPKKPGVGFLGVGLSTSLLKFDYPINIEIEQGDVSGPSAGLAFTLSIIDKLTVGELTGGKDYAVTGEIGIDGKVYPVGGVAQKAVAAKNSGAKFMIVPKGEAKDAKPKVGKMKLFEVENIDQALKVLNKNGGDPLPQVRACPNS
ncbi:MAG: PDZ domain-containing protein [Acidimicrobiia bacterium]|nr:PDZ domain-containing protein [Acidimicrobiia bacterium]